MEKNLEKEVFGIFEFDDVWTVIQMDKTVADTVPLILL